MSEAVFVSDVLTRAHEHRFADVFSTFAKEGGRIGGGTLGSGQGGIGRCAG
ncbi:hypothetical protein [Streptomyces sp. B6B3]|uniref:hypothetical protein n=1 Tax=Streptomyces sp. B6B3 TaxID=3153570 RepID=UPI00325CD11F